MSARGRAKPRSKAPRTTKRSWRPTIAAAVLGLVAIVLTVYYTLGLYLPSLMTTHTTLEGVPHERSTVRTTPGLARRVVVVVVDGLTFEKAHEIDELADLRRRGLIRPMRAEFPSYTRPAFEEFMTGVGPRDSGVRLNGDETGVAGLDSVLDEAALLHVPIRIFARGWPPFPRLLHAPDSAFSSIGRVGFAVHHVLQVIGREEITDTPDGKSPAKELDFVYTDGPDDAGHRFGGASAEYDRAAHDAGALVAAIASTLDFDQDTLVALSDHGHIARGGHGGIEPESLHSFFLIAGGFARRGVEISEGRPRDVAATLAVLAGVHVPTSILGLPMVDALALDDAETSAVLAQSYDEALHFTCRLHASPFCEGSDASDKRSIVAHLADADPVAGPIALERFARVTADRESYLANVAALNAQRRLVAVSVLLAALLAAALIALSRNGDALAKIRVPAALVPVVYVVAYCLLLRALGYRSSFSTLKASGDFQNEALPAAFVAAVFAIGFGVWARPGARGGIVTLVVIGIPFALLAAYVGWDPAVLPPPELGALTFLLSPAIVGASVTAIALSAIEARRAS